MALLGGDLGPGRPLARLVEDGVPGGGGRLGVHLLVRALQALTHFPLLFQGEQWGAPPPRGAGRGRWGAWRASRRPGSAGPPPSRSSTPPAGKPLPFSHTRQAQNEGEPCGRRSRCRPPCRGRPRRPRGAKKFPLISPLLKEREVGYLALALGLRLGALRGLLVLVALLKSPSLSKMSWRKDGFTNLLTLSHLHLVVVALALLTRGLGLHLLAAAVAGHLAISYPLRQKNKASPLLRKP